MPSNRFLTSFSLCSDADDFIWMNAKVCEQVVTSRSLGYLKPKRHVSLVRETALWMIGLQVDLISSSTFDDRYF